MKKILWILLCAVSLPAQTVDQATEGTTDQGIEETADEATVSTTGKTDKVDGSTTGKADGAPVSTTGEAAVVTAESAKSNNWQNWTFAGVAIVVVVGAVIFVSLDSGHPAH